jgi:hypothetical protein
MLGLKKRMEESRKKGGASVASDFPEYGTITSGAEADKLH